MPFVAVREADLATVPADTWSTLLEEAEARPVATVGRHRIITCDRPPTPELWASAGAPIVARADTRGGVERWLPDEPEYELPTPETHPEQFSDEPGPQQPAPEPENDRLGWVERAFRLMMGERGN